MSDVATAGAVRLASVFGKSFVRPAVRCDRPRDRGRAHANYLTQFLLEPQSWAARGMWQYPPALPNGPAYSPASMSRSRALTKGYRGRIFAIFAVIVVVAAGVLVGVGAALAPAGHAALNIFQSAAATIIAAFGGVLNGVFYFELRVARTASTSTRSRACSTEGRERPPAYRSTLAVSAFSWMNSRRGSTTSPISLVNRSSASSASLTFTCRSERALVSRVVSHSCPGFISPRPL